MDDHVGQFLHYLSVEKGSSANTIAAYGIDLSQFRGYLSASRNGNGDTSWKDVDRSVVVDYIADLKRREYAEATVARKVAAIKAFFAYLHQVEGVVKLNPTDNVGFRVPKSLPKPLSIKEVDELLEQPARNNTPEARRDKAMLELLYATGMRVTELVSLDVGHVHISPRAPHVRCLGKGSKERTIPIHKDALNALQDYLNDGRLQLVQEQASERPLREPAGRPADAPGLLADTEGLRAEGGDHEVRYSSYLAPQLRYSYAERRRAPAKRAGASRSR